MEVCSPEEFLEEIIACLLDIEVGQPVTLQCSTSTAHIFLKKDAEGGRVKCVPEPVQLLAISYPIPGKYGGIEEPGDSGITYAIVFRWDGKRQIKQSVPLTAIIEVGKH